MQYNVPRQNIMNHMHFRQQPTQANVHRQEAIHNNCLLVTCGSCGALNYVKYERITCVILAQYQTLLVNNAYRYTTHDWMLTLVGLSSVVLGSHSAELLIYMDISFQFYGANVNVVIMLMINQADCINLTPHSEHLIYIDYSTTTHH